MRPHLRAVALVHLLAAMAAAVYFGLLFFGHDGASACTGPVFLLATLAAISVLVGLGTAGLILLRSHFTGIFTPLRLTFVAAANCLAVVGFLVASRLMNG